MKRAAGGERGEEESNVLNELSQAVGLRRAVRSKYHRGGLGAFHAHLAAHGHAACRLPRFKGEPPPPTCMKPRSPKGPEEDSSSWFGSEITREQKQRNAEVCM